MRQILRSISFAPERYKKTVSKALLKILHTYIGAPLEITYRIDFARQRTESVLNFPYLSAGSVVLELEQHDMAQDPGRFALGDIFGRLDTYTAGQNNRSHCQIQNIPEHTCLPPKISLLILFHQFLGQGILSAKPSGVHSIIIKAKAH
jgi:hypothetical protein